MLKLNFNAGQFYLKKIILVISKNCKICSEIKFEKENVEYVRWKLWVENFESKILSDFKLNKTGMDRFQDCCKAKATNTLLQS